MASKYSARSNLVTGFLSPASGHRALSGLEMVTPRTVLGAPVAAESVRSGAVGLAPLALAEAPPEPLRSGADRFARPTVVDVPALLQTRAPEVLRPVVEVRVAAPFAAFGLAAAAAVR